MGRGQAQAAAEAVSVRLIVREAAQEDIREAVEWYDRQSPGLGAEFVRCVDACLSLISRHPEPERFSENLAPRRQDAKPERERRPSRVLPRPLVG